MFLWKDGRSVEGRESYPDGKGGNKGGGGRGSQLRHYKQYSGLREWDGRAFMTLEDAFGGDLGHVVRRFG